MRKVMVAALLATLAFAPSGATATAGPTVGGN